MDASEDIVLDGDRVIFDMSLVMDLVDDRVDSEEMLPFLLGASGVSRETTLTPTASPVVAGMKSEVIPCFFKIVL